jgi:hypothetical protein
MRLTSTQSTRPRLKSLPTTATPKPTEGPAKDSFIKTAGKKTLDVIKNVAQKAQPYAKSALIAAAPAIATAVAFAVGGAPAAGIAILGSGVVGMGAGAVAWGKDIGIIRGAAGGGLTGMASAFLGAIGGGFGVLNMAAIGATREVILRHLADVDR